MKIKNEMMAVEAANTLIEAGHVLMIAGHQNLLQQLKKGNWVGGSTTYFMDKHGGGVNKKEIFVTDLTNEIINFRIGAYDENTVTTTLLEDRYENGFSYLVLPAFSSVHQYYGLNAGQQATLFDHPIVGWITGVHLDLIGQEKPLVIDGSTGKLYEEKAVALHAELAANRYAEIDIVNIYEQGQGDTFTFLEDSFDCSDCLINGKPANLADYYTSNNIDVSLPLVANYAGASINVSIEKIHEAEKRVSFFAPVLHGQEYKLAPPIEDRYTMFCEQLPKDNSNTLLSCNCVLNYVYIDMKDKLTGSFRGPFTFGEVAYILVNQTMVTLTIVEG